MEKDKLSHSAEDFMLFEAAARIRNIWVGAAGKRVWPTGCRRARPVRSDTNLIGVSANPELARHSALRRVPTPRVRRGPPGPICPGCTTSDMTMSQARSVYQTQDGHFARL